MSVSLVGILKSFKQTIKRLFSKPVTVHYPGETAPISERFRGRIVLDMEACIGCTLCSQACPNGTDCMQVIPGREQANNKRGLWPRVNVVQCMYCGLCEEVCPTDAIFLTPEFRTSRTDRGEFDYDAIQLSKTEAELTMEGQKELEGGL
jgi:NADH-quinone oxidoreductase subunit I